MPIYTIRVGEHPNLGVCTVIVYARNRILPVLLPRAGLAQIK
jgi:hypothetical protein